MPKTVPFKQIKEKKAPAAAKNTNGQGAVEAGQTTLDGKAAATNGSNGVAHDGAEDSIIADPNAQLEMESRDAGTANGKGESEDVEMEGTAS